MSGAVGSSMVGHYFGKLKDEPKISIRKYCDIYLICKQDTKDKKLKKLTQIVIDVGRDERLAESILCHMRMIDGS
jgi:hypothetical protein